MTAQAIEALPPELPSEDAILAFTHGLRLKVIDEMFGKEGKLPEDPTDRKTIVSVLKDMDAQALGRKRIRVEEKLNSNQEQAAGLIAAVLNATAGHSAFRISKSVVRQIPVLPDNIPNPILVNGETETIAASLDYESFVASMTPVDEEGSS